MCSKDVMYKKTMPSVNVFNAENKVKLRRVRIKLQNIERKINAKKGSK